MNALSFDPVDSPFGRKMSPGDTASVSQLNKPVDRLLHVLPEWSEPVVLRIVLAVTPNVWALIERNGVPHGTLEDALERLRFSSHWVAS